MYQSIPYTRAEWRKDQAKGYWKYARQPTIYDRENNLRLFLEKEKPWDRKSGKLDTDYSTGCGMNDDSKRRTGYRRKMNVYNSKNRWYSLSERQKAIEKAARGFRFGTARKFGAMKKFVGTKWDRVGGVQRPMKTVSKIDRLNKYGLRDISGHHGLFGGRVTQQTNLGLSGIPGVGNQPFSKPYAMNENPLTALWRASRLLKETQEKRKFIQLTAYGDEDMRYVLRNKSKKQKVLEGGTTVDPGRRYYSQEITKKTECVRKAYVANGMPFYNKFGNILRSNSSSSGNAGNNAKSWKSGAAPAPVIEKDEKTGKYMIQEFKRLTSSDSRQLFKEKRHPTERELEKIEKAVKVRENLKKELIADVLTGNFLKGSKIRFNTHVKEDCGLTDSQYRVLWQLIWMGGGYKEGRV